MPWTPEGDGWAPYLDETGRRAWEDQPYAALSAGQPIELIREGWDAPWVQTELGQHPEMNAVGLWWRPVAGSRK